MRPGICPIHRRRGCTCGGVVTPTEVEMLAEQTYYDVLRVLPWGEASDEVKAEIRQRVDAALKVCPPSEHRPVQHRDGRKPWCNTCGLTARYNTPEVPSWIG